MMPLELKWYSSPLVVFVHLGSFGLLLAWSFTAMVNTRRLVPGTTYQSASSGLMIVGLWCLAAIGVAASVSFARGLIEESDLNEMAPVVVLTVLVLLAFVLLWLPFRYLKRHGARAGAPGRRSRR